MDLVERQCFDPQKKRVYSAEREAFKDQKYITQCKARLFLASIISSEWYMLKGYPPVNIEFMSSNLRGNSVYHYAYYQHIFLAKNYVTESDIIHELSHAVVNCGKGNNPHGKAFCRRYLNFTGMYMSQDYYSALREAFLRHRVKF